MKVLEVSLIKLETRVFGYLYALPVLQISRCRRYTCSNDVQIQPSLRAKLISFFPFDIWISQLVAAIITLWIKYYHFFCFRLHNLSSEKKTTKFKGFIMVSITLTGQCIFISMKFMKLHWYAWYSHIYSFKFNTLPVID